MLGASASRTPPGSASSGRPLRSISSASASCSRSSRCTRSDRSERRPPSACSCRRSRSRRSFLAPVRAACPTGSVASPSSSSRSSGTAVGSFLTGPRARCRCCSSVASSTARSGASVSVAQAAVTDVRRAVRAAALARLARRSVRRRIRARPRHRWHRCARSVTDFRSSWPAASLLVNALVAIRRLPETRPSALSRRRTGADPPRSSRMCGPTCRRLALLAFVRHRSVQRLRGDVLALRPGSIRSVGELDRCRLRGSAWVSCSCRADSSIPLCRASVPSAPFAPGSCSTPSGSAAAVAVDAGGRACPRRADRRPGPHDADPLLARRGPLTQDRRGGALGFQQSAGGMGRVVGPALAGVLFGRSASARRTSSGPGSSWPSRWC